MLSQSSRQDSRQLYEQAEAALSGLHALLPQLPVESLHHHGNLGDHTASEGGSGVCVAVRCVPWCVCVAWCVYSGVYAYPTAW